MMSVWLCNLPIKENKFEQEALIQINKQIILGQIEFKLNNFLLDCDYNHPLISVSSLFHC